MNWTDVMKKIKTNLKDILREPQCSIELTNKVSKIYMDVARLELLLGVLSEQGNVQKLNNSDLKTKELGQ